MKINSFFHSKKVHSSRRFHKSRHLYQKVSPAKQQQKKNVNKLLVTVYTTVTIVLLSVTSVKSESESTNSMLILITGQV